MKYCQCYKYSADTFRQTDWIKIPTGFGTNFITTPYMQCDVFTFISVNYSRATILFFLCIYPNSLFPFVSMNVDIHPSVSAARVSLHKLFGFYQVNVFWKNTSWPLRLPLGCHIIHRSRTFPITCHSANLSLCRGDTHLLYCSYLWGTQESGLSSFNTFNAFKPYLIVSQQSYQTYERLWRTQSLFFLLCFFLAIRFVMRKVNVPFLFTSFHCKL